jgi:hypothetical protein
MDQKTLSRSRITHIKQQKQNRCASDRDHGNAQFGPKQQPTNNLAAPI